MKPLPSRPGSGQSKTVCMNRSGYYHDQRLFDNPAARPEKLGHVFTTKMQVGSQAQRTVCSWCGFKQPVGGAQFNVRR